MEEKRYMVTIDHDYSVIVEESLYRAYVVYYAAEVFGNEIGVDVTLVDDSTGELIAWNNDSDM